MRPKVERPGNEMSGQGFHESFGESRKYVNGAVLGYLRRRIVWHVQRLARTLLLIRVRLLQGSCVGECLRRAALEGLPPIQFLPRKGTAAEPVGLEGSRTEPPSK